MWKGEECVEAVKGALRLKMSNEGIEDRGLEERDRCSLMKVCV